MKKLFSLKQNTPKDLKYHGGKWQLPLLIFLLLLLPFMAVVQHHYLGKLSEAEKVRLKTNLEIAAKNFSKDFDNELIAIQQTFRLNEDPSIGFEPRLHQTYLTWKQTTSFPGLIKDIYFLNTRNVNPALNIFDIQKGTLSICDWPVELDKIKMSHPSTSGGGQIMSIYFPETLILNSPPLIMSEYRYNQISDNDTSLSWKILSDFIIIVLDPDEVRSNLLSSLFRKHFPVQNDYQLDIVIAKENRPDDVFYFSNPDIDITDFHNAEVQTEIGQWGQQGKDIRQAEVVKINSLSMNQSPKRKELMTDNNDINGLFNLISSRKMRPQPEKWELMLKIRNDTLEGILGKSRKRNLFTSYCILAILGISMVMVYVSTRQLGSLARRQLKFVYGVSHELRTPISVIRSAGENLADGLITDADQQKQYGRLIRDEGRRLSSMVENILSFSTLQNGKTTLSFKAARIIDILEECIISRSGSNDLPEPNIKIESDSNVPLVKVDYNSIKIAFNNVIENSIKYSPDDLPILIRIRYTSSDNELVISFEDNGRGIDAEDLPFIFDPFFRGKNTEEIRTPGNGIGLSLVNDIIKKHGGRIEVESKRYKGTVVSIILPVIPETEEV